MATGWYQDVEVPPLRAIGKVDSGVDRCLPTSSHQKRGRGVEKLIDLFNPLREVSAQGVRSVRPWQTPIPREVLRLRLR